MRKQKISIWLYLSIFALCSFEKSPDKSTRTPSFVDRVENKIVRAQSPSKTEMELVQFINTALNNENIQERIIIGYYTQVYQDISEFRLLEKRYKKGIDIIKLLNEKILSLNHHFAGLDTYQKITSISNPSNYSEFRDARAQIEKKMKKKFSLNLPKFLDSNPFISSTFSLVGVILGEGNQKNKEEELNKIACILDFTISMNNDLTTIYHEINFLRGINEELSKESELLFHDYTKVIGYLVPLKECRNNDDWDNLDEILERFIQKNENLIADGNILSSSLRRDRINLEFSTERVSNFINKYNDLISLYTQYYQKFDNILSNYENEAPCMDQLPQTFSELKFDLKSTIEKFNNTYSLPEIQGSRLRDLLYGFN